MTGASRTTKLIGIGIVASVVLGVASAVATDVSMGKAFTAMSSPWALVPLALTAACLLSATATVCLAVVAAVRHRRFVRRQAEPVSTERPAARPLSARPRRAPKPGRQKATRPLRTR